MPVPVHEIICSSSKSPKDCVRSQCIAGLLLLLCLCAAPSPVAGQSYFFSSFDEPNATSPGSGIPPRTFAYGVNDSATVVGSYSCCTSGFHAFQRDSNTYTILDYPSSSCGFSHCGDEVRGINNSGVVVGDSTDASGNTIGYTYANGNYAVLEFPGATYMQPNAINNNGVIVGIYDDASFVQHGFTFNGAFTTFDGCPAGSTMPYLSGINDAGDMVGYCFTSSVPQEPLGFKFTAASGQFTTVSFPGALATRALGINNSGQIAGRYNDSNGHSHGFLLSQGNYITVDPPGSTLTEVWAINNHGQIVGDYADAAGACHAFVASSAQLVDPVDSDPSNSLLSGPAITTDPKLLGTRGRPVQGVASDGVTEAVVIVPAVNVGDQFTLTLLNDSGTQINPNEDGALGNPGDSSFSQSQLTITAAATSSNPSNPAPAAFAVYRAPVDFARQVSAGLYKSGSCGGQPVSDDQSGCRSVTIQIQNVATGSTASVQVSILRPPVVLIHGLWGDRHNWDNFSPLYSNFGTPAPDSRFYVGLIDYSKPPSDVFIVSSSPDYSSLPAGQGTAVLANAGANSLGFQYNTRGVMSQISEQVKKFKIGVNPVNAAVAAIQADVVGHSMGGDISRTIALQFNFLSNETFAQGSIHKLITIDTPHLGSPLATQLLQSQNSCVAGVFALNHLPAFSSVQVGISSGPATLALPGAVGDLADTPSQALQNIAAPGQHPLPTALIAGTANSTNFGGLATSGTAAALRNTCGTLASNPLATNLTPAGWPTIFGSPPNNANDAIVGLSSELNGLNPDPGLVFDGNVHSPGIEKLGFNGPSVLDAGSSGQTACSSSVPNQVVCLLNTPVGNAIFHQLNP